jgi:hypothetical protein
MRCRVCEEEIVFIKGKQPSMSRTATFAVHQSRLADTLKQAHGVVVMPQLSYQRKLRAALEELHPSKLNTAMAIERMDTDLDNPNICLPSECDDTATSGAIASLSIDPYIARTTF